MDNIEILKNKIENLKKYNSYSYTCTEQDFKKIVNLIQENKELKEKINRQQEQLNIANKKILSQKGQLKVVNNSYIPKSKVKEKIKELEKQAEEVKNHYKGTYACLDEYLNAKSKIQGFKELLEEGE